MIIQEKAILLENRPLSPEVCALVLKAPGIAKEAQAGQFVNVYLEDGIHLLPRPISLCKIDRAEGRLTLVLARVGAGTQVLYHMPAGAEIPLLGPLGNGYDLSRLSEFSRIFYVGGGVGIPPLVELSKRIHEITDIPTFAFLGFRERPFMGEEMEPYTQVCRCSDTLEEAGLFHGNAVQALKAHLSREKAEGKALAFACGPKGMLKGLKALCLEEGIAMQFSLEERMGCGFGACHGCVVALEKEGRRILQNVCTDGPVFAGEEVCFDE